MNKLAAAWVAALGFLVAGEGVSAAKDRSAHDSCVEGRVNVDDVNRQVLVSIVNSCEERLRCVVSWELRCGKDSATPTREEFFVEGHATAQRDRAVVNCSDPHGSYAGATWRCDPPRTDAARRPHGK